MTFKIRKTNAMSYGMDMIKACFEDDTRSSTDAVIDSDYSINVQKNRAIDKKSSVSDDLKKQEEGDDGQKSILELLNWTYYLLQFNFYYSIWQSGLFINYNNLLYHILNPYGVLTSLLLNTVILPTFGGFFLDSIYVLKDFDFVRRYVFQGMKITMAANGGYLPFLCPYTHLADCELSLVLLCFNYVSQKCTLKLLMAFQGLGHLDLVDINSLSTFVPFLLSLVVGLINRAMIDHLSFKGMKINLEDYKPVMNFYRILCNSCFILLQLKSFWNRLGYFLHILTFAEWAVIFYVLAVGVCLAIILSDYVYTNYIDETYVEIYEDNSSHQLRVYTQRLRTIFKNSFIERNNNRYELRSINLSLFHSIKYIAFMKAIILDTIAKNQSLVMNIVKTNYYGCMKASKFLTTMPIMYQFISLLAIILVLMADMILSWGVELWYHCKCLYDNACCRYFGGRISEQIRLRNLGKGTKRDGKNTNKKKENDVKKED